MIHIQSTTERNRAHHFDAASAMFGALDNGLSPRFTSMEEVLSGKFDANIRHDMYVGSTEFMREIFKKLNVDPRVPFNSPATPKHTVTIKDAKAILSDGKPLFVKPATQQKLFTGLVLRNAHFLNTYPDDAMVLMYTPFNAPILSETRVYVHNKKPMFIGNYSGDIWTFPTKEFVRQIINDVCKDFPVCYTIDVAVVTDDSLTQHVVEFNDMWAIGNYGMANDLYFALLKDRWTEIIKTGR